MLLLLLASEECTLLVVLLGVAVVFEEVQHLSRLVPEVSGGQAGAGLRADEQVVGVVGGDLTFGALARGCWDQAWLCSFAGNLKIQT